MTSSSQEPLTLRPPRLSGEDVLKEYILSRNLRPGDRLPPEHDLAVELGASRNVIREALRALQALGIVDIRHGIGVYIQEATLSSLTDSLTFWSRIAARDGLEALYPIAEVREVLEVNLLDRVIGAHSEADLADLQAAVDEMRAAAAAGSYAPEADGRFHELLYRPLGNWVLIFLIRAFWDAFDEIARNSPRTRRPPQEIAEQHAAILDALRCGDQAAARAEMVRHFDNQLRR